MLASLFQHDEPPTLPGEFALVRVSRRAMATRFEIAIPANTHCNPIAAGTAALDLIDDLEQQMTVYRADSEVSLLNDTAADAPIVIEASLFELFQRCAVWTRETNSAFDIALGAMIDVWAECRRRGEVPSPQQRSHAMARTGFGHVVLEQERHTVKFRVPGLKLNLGAVGKGYALDRAAELLQNEWGITAALLHGGGSSVRGIGHPPGERRGWPIRLQDPNQPTESLGTLYLRDRALGTSAATYQFFEYKGEKLGHLLDPRLGWPADSASKTASASVTASTAAEADAMSTAAFVLGMAGTETLLKLKPALGAVMLTASGLPNRTLGPRASRPLSGGNTAAKMAAVPGSDDLGPQASRPLSGGNTAGGTPAVPGFVEQSSPSKPELATFNLAPEAYSPPSE